MQVDSTEEARPDGRAFFSDTGLAATPQLLRLEFHGSGAEYFRIWIVNLLLTLVTLGLYGAWAKVRRMRYFYGHTLLAGSAFEYHGEPKRILKGRLIAAALIAPYYLFQKTLSLASLVFALLFVVALTRHDGEITAVLAHEVGHVVHRHATRLLLQTSVSALVLFAVLGDVSSVSSLAAGAPALLTQARYSRQLEREADDYSYAWLRAHQIPTHYFGDVLSRLGASQGGDAAISYLSSHPRIDERIHN